MLGVLTNAPPRMGRTWLLGDFLFPSNFYLLSVLLCGVSNLYLIDINRHTEQILWAG